MSGTDVVDLMGRRQRRPVVTAPPRGIAQVRADAPAAVLMVDLAGRRVLYANDVALQMAPGLRLPVSVDDWATAADLRDLDGEALDETAHPLSRIARFEPVAGQGVSAARATDLGSRREPLWVVALPLDAAPNLRDHALVVFLPVRDRAELQDRAEAAHARAAEQPPAEQPPAEQPPAEQPPAEQPPGVEAAAAGRQPARDDVAAVREAAVLATGLSFTVADALDPEMPLVWVNPAFTAVTGYTFEQSVGRNCRFLQGPSTDRATVGRLREALRGGEPAIETLLNHRADGTAFWNQVTMSPILDARGRVTHYVGIQTDVTGQVAADAERDRALAAEQRARAVAERAQAEAEAAHSRLQLLAEVSGQLSELVDPEQSFDRLAHLLVPELADFALLAVVADDAVVPAPAGARPGAGASPTRQVARGRHGLRDVAWWHHDPARRDDVERLARTRLTSLSADGRAVLTSLLGPDARAVHGLDRLDEQRGPGSPTVVEQHAGSFDPGEAHDALLSLAPTSVVTWALRSRGRTLGLLTLGTGPGRAPMSSRDTDLGSDVAARAGLALDRSRLFRQQRDLAEGLQRSLLDLSPNAAPAHVRTAVRYVAAAEAAQVGGDFYDVFTQPGGAAVAVIGDVMGHDTQAAAAMAQLRSIVRTLGMVGDGGPDEVLRRADEVMRASGVDTTATAAVVRISAPAPCGAAEETGSVELAWSNAGHPPPVVISADGDVALLEATSTDLLLGVDPGTRRQLSRTRLAPGAMLLLYTDGLVERRDQPLSEGIARLLTAAHRAWEGCDDLDGLVDAVLEAMVPGSPSDDVALVALSLS